MSITNKLLKLLLCLSIYFCISCQADTSSIPIAPNNNEVIRLKLEKSYRKGRDGIPELLRVIQKNISTPYKLDSYSAVNHSVNYLYMLAKKEIYTKESLPVLLKTLKNQIHIKDTYRTAETIKIITGVDVGYNRKFVNNYTPENEGTRQLMIKKWDSL